MVELAPKSGILGERGTNIPSIFGFAMMAVGIIYFGLLAVKSLDPSTSDTLKSLVFPFAIFIYSTGVAFMSYGWAVSANSKATKMQEEILETVKRIEERMASYEELRE